MGDLHSSTDDCTGTGTVDIIEEEEEEEITTTNISPLNEQQCHQQQAAAEQYDFFVDTSWREVAITCCVRTPEEWCHRFLYFCVILFFLYFFLIGLELLGNGAKVMTGCRAGSLFGDEANPVGGLMVGILVTVLLQSSSTTTSIVVALVGAGTVTVDQGIYMVMGANIGTSVTNTIVAMGQMGDSDSLERAFAGATVHDMFNFLTVAILFPIEVITGYLSVLTGALVKNAETSGDNDSWQTPLDKIIDPVVNKIIAGNAAVVQAVAKGGSCTDFYPIECTNGIISYDTCAQALIKCDKDTNDCPIFFNPEATQSDEIVAGAVCFVIAILILFICFCGLVFSLQKLLFGVSTRILLKATNVNPYISMMIGAAITIFVQSSSITTSVLTPLVGAGVLRLENMLPLTLGANIGTTITALVASMVSDSINALQVALAHLFFNITGILIWYPIPFMRKVPVNAARQLGKMTRIWRGFPILYIAVCFFLLPLFFFGLSSMYMGTQGLVALATLITIFFGVGLIYTIYWCRYLDGKEKTIEAFEERQRMRVATTTLPDTLDDLYDEIAYLRSKVQMLIDHTGAPDDDDHEGDYEGDEEQQQQQHQHHRLVDEEHVELIEKKKKPPRPTTNKPSSSKEKEKAKPDMLTATDTTTPEQEEDNNDNDDEDDDDDGQVHPKTRASAVSLSSEC